MERREAIKFTALFMGISMSASTVAAIMAGCQTDTTDGWVPVFLSGTDAAFIGELAETILPRTATPGAKDAFVERFIDAIRPLRFSTEDNDRFMSDLAAFISQSKNEIGVDFIKASPQKRLDWVTAVDKASYASIKENEAGTATERPFYLVLKEHILGGYFNSEIVAKEFFAFDPNPGRYDACIPYEQVGKAWAL